MLDLTEDQIAANELRIAAYHEAGHKILYQRFGGDGDALVWKNPDKNPDEAAWLGQFRPRTSPEVMRDIAVMHGHFFPELPTNWRRLVGLAGMVAEEFLLDPTDDVRAVSDALYLKIVFGEASATDIAVMGIADTDNFELDFKDVEDGMRYLREDWLLVQQEAEYLIAEALTEPA